MFKETVISEIKMKDIISTLKVVNAIYNAGRFNKLVEKTLTALNANVEIVNDYDITLKFKLDE